MIRVLCSLMLFGWTTGLTYRWGSTKVQNMFQDLWPDDIVPYTFEGSDLNEAEKGMIKGAMNTIRDKTKSGERLCIRFTEKNMSDTYFVTFLKLNAYLCTSEGVGRQIGTDKKNIVYLGHTCFDEGIIIHELMHALGFLHEHVRPNRDRYVKIDLTNIPLRFQTYFEKESRYKVTTQDLPYDYGSLLHYGPYQLANDRSQPTITPKRQLPNGTTMGQRVDMSKTDVLRIQILYSCPIDSSDNKDQHETGYEFYCGFDENLCNLLQSDRDDFNWSRSSGATSREGTGPNTDHLMSGRGTYLYAEAKGHLGEVAKISTPTMKNGTYCLQLYFYSYGTDVGELLLFIKSIGNKKRYTLNIDPSVNRWRSFERTVKAEASWSAQFVSKVGNGTLGYVAIDDISITEGRTCY